MMYHSAPRIAVVSLALWACSCSSTPSDTARSGVTDTGAGESDIATFEDVTSEEGTDSSTDTGSDTSRDADAGCFTLGCPCEEEVDCESFFCIENRDGTGDICSELCDDECSEPGYDCELLENSGGDVVRICVPQASPYCQPCDIDTDCRSLTAVCFESLEGEVCATACESAADCPEGAICEGIAGEDGQFCVPIEGVCDGCVDSDVDGYGVGPDCNGPDPDDEDPTTYPGAPELCDGIDNDGDGQTDEGVDNACGGCATLAGEPGTECGGECGDGLFLCSDDGESVFCSAPGGEDLFNACGGCAELPDEPGNPCEDCGGTWSCDGLEALICERDTTDSDDDGVCDPDDLCPGFDDAIDRDGDGVPDACADACPPGTYGAECAPCPPCERGTCDDGRAGDGSCDCEPDFEGASCDRCASGRFGPDCAAACDCDRGVCDDGRDGTGACGCEPGFSGADCSECIAGRFGMECTEVCDCGAGSCDDGRDGSGSCDCPAGFSGPDCSECAAGRFGVDCTPCPPCDRGTCDEGRAGSGGCACDPFFTGADCSACQDGFYGPECRNCPRCIIGTECVDGRDGDGTCSCVASAADDRTCNGIDDDCDGSIDEDAIRTYYVDSDGDGYGSAASGTELGCELGAGYSLSNDDCDDGNREVNPGASETCNRVDDDCDGAVDNGAPPSGVDDDCDGVDDDCDGAADDDFEPLPFGCCLPCGRDGVYQEFDTETVCIGGRTRCVPREGAVCRDGAECF